MEIKDYSEGYIVIDGICIKLIQDESGCFHYEAADARVTSTELELRVHDGIHPAGGECQFHFRAAYYKGVFI